MKASADPVRPVNRYVRALSILLPVLILLAAEGTVRLTLRWKDPIRLFVRGGGHAGDAYGARTFTGDPDLGWKLRPGLVNQWWEYTTITTNREGLRADREYPRAKRGPRILCLGDSVTFGYRVPETYPGDTSRSHPDERAYPELLERLIREKYPGLDVDVIPMGVPGYTSYQGRLWLERDIDSLRPDLVTILFGFNDAAPGVPDRVALSNSFLRRWARRAIYGSQALTYLLLSLRSDAGDDRAATEIQHPRVSTDEYLDNIHAMVELARRRGAKAVVMGQVYREADPGIPQDALIIHNRQALARACRNWGAPYLEIEELTESAAGQNADLFFGKVHPNARGHRLLAERLFALIMESDLLERVAPNRNAAAWKERGLSGHGL